MKLLIVDDEYHVIKTVRYLLQISPIQFDEIFEAQSAKDAITIIERERPEILITDVLMADVTGLDLMNYLNNTSIPIKTIVISGYNNFEYIRAALKEGGVDYLLKPIDADQLFSAVETAINQWEKEDAQKRQTLKHLDMIQSMSSLCKETLLYRIMTQSSIEKYYQDLLQIVPGLKQCRNCMVGYANCGPFFSTHSEKSYNVLKNLSPLWMVFFKRITLVPASGVLMIPLRYCFFCTITPVMRCRYFRTFWKNYAVNMHFHSVLASVVLWLFHLWLLTPANRPVLRFSIKLFSTNLRSCFSIIRYVNLPANWNSLIWNRNYSVH